MIDKIKEHIARVNEFQTQSASEAEAFRIEYLGKKGLLNEFFAEFKNVPNDQKRILGRLLIRLRILHRKRLIN